MMEDRELWASTIATVREFAINATIVTDLRLAFCWRRISRQAEIEWITKDRVKIKGGGEIELRIQNKPTATIVIFDGGEAQDRPPPPPGELLRPVLT